MSQKVKFKESKGVYRVNMTFEECQLVASLLQRTRLGFDDVYKDAAKNLLDGFCEFPEFEDSLTMDQDLAIGVTIEDMDGNAVAQFADPYSIILEVNELLPQY